MARTVQLPTLGSYDEARITDSCASRAESSKPNGLPPTFFLYFFSRDREQKTQILTKMGNRVKGRVKKKSIKAAISSTAGSKRKLSRMGKKQKKEHAGLEASYIGRAQCLKRLQVTLKDFRRLCILKGIYPREPRSRVPGKKKWQSFYHIKDLRALAHEPVLEKFREFRAFMKKVSGRHAAGKLDVFWSLLFTLFLLKQVRKAAGRNEKDLAAQKYERAPTYTVHHLVKERYPRFIDAIADMDDALTLTYLFAALPSEQSIPAKVILQAKSLAAAWGAYCATTSSITMSFISVKGVYLEASVRGMPVRWIVPHAFTQMLPEDVDYKVMLTFFEFYETLLNFILFKLYNDLGLRYPLPTIAAGQEVKGSTSSILAAHLHTLFNAAKVTNGAITGLVSDAVEQSTTLVQTESIERKGYGKDKTKAQELVKKVGAALNRLQTDGSDGEEEMDEDDDVDVAGPLKAALDTMAEDEARNVIPGVSGPGSTLDDDALKRRMLFSGLTFFLSREVPRGYLELVCIAYGGRVGWEGGNSPISMDDSSITHHVVDRPRLLSNYASLPKSREFIQPQWIVDCANFMFLLPIAKYGVGAELPPHLSPWVDDEEEGYKPAYAEEIERLKNGDILDDNDVDFKQASDDVRILAIDDPKVPNNEMDEGEEHDEEDQELDLENDKEEEDDDNESEEEDAEDAEDAEEEEEEDEEEEEEDEEGIRRKQGKMKEKEVSRTPKIGVLFSIRVFV